MAQKEHRESTPSAGEPSRLLTYLQLLRLPNVFTAVADVTMGFLFIHVIHVSPFPVLPFLFILAASCGLYLGGMVLNDVFDVEQDREERPERPLPSGRISLSRARVLGWGLLATGVLFGVAAGPVASNWFDEPLVSPWRPAIVTGLLALSVVLYDAVFKATWIGPLFMGACRFFNVLLGMSLIPVTAPIGVPVPLLEGLGVTLDQLCIAGGIGIYVLGITWFGRTEARKSNRWSLSLGLLLMIAGISLLALFPRYASQDRRWFFDDDMYYVLLLMLLAVTIVRRAAVAIASAQPQQVQAAIKHSILSLIVLDAAVVLYAAGPPWALLVVALLAPALGLGKWVYST